MRVRLCFWVNDPYEILNSQTTAMLIRAAVRAGHEVSVAGVGELSRAASGDIVGSLVPVPAACGTPPCAGEAQLGEQLRAVGAKRASLQSVQAVMFRTNPARDPLRAHDHRAALSFARVLQARGVVVLNDPNGLQRAADKLYLSHLPANVTPPTLMSRRAQELLEFVQAQPGDCVLKPAAGTRGQNVFRVRANDANLRQIIEVLVADGVAMAQPFVAGGEGGDVRMVLLEGEPLTVQGWLAAIARVPGAGEFRSNIHQGGHARPAELTPVLGRIAQALRPRLLADGLWLTGVDVIGEHVIELNVFSTGGLRDAERFTGQDFSGAIIAALGRRVLGA